LFAAVLNLCRDEICNSLKHKVKPIFGDPFNVHGLGGVLTCGVTGMGAGLSHCPQSPGEREKYVFFSFPHIAVNAAGELGEISRASRHHSHACGAMLKVLGELKKEGHACSSHKVGQKEGECQSLTQLSLTHSQCIPLSRTLPLSTRPFRCFLTLMA
jgi:hypothetical protein